ncbi:MAG: ATP-binding protein [Acidobacteriota bacterium]|nr:ATP-binding protein [Blastocatellia bacterium]MDW8240228.1 ATP-binding protein [Acidobacteriota bacterium]
MNISTLKLERLGPIQQADISFGDWTVLVGPQATGKSIFLQFLKLVADIGYVHDELRKHGIDWRGSLPTFLDVYFGEGMQEIWRNDTPPSALVVNGQPYDAGKLVRVRNRKKKHTVFYIPAQRVLSLANGWPRPFTSFASEDPFTVRDFSETFRILMEQELGRAEALFPQTNRLKKEYRDLLSQHVFGGFGLRVDRHGAQKRLVLRRSDASKSIPYLAWSAGQREFVPLLMGLYWLMPAAKVKRRDQINWVIIEELEMGLHPNAISVVLLLIMELLWREYRVCISTHSTHVLDVVWAMQMMREHKVEPSDLLDLFNVSKTKPMKEVASAVLQKEVRVYYFGRDGQTRDISRLDPGSEEEREAGWGGLTEFSGLVNKVVADVVNRHG